MGEEKEVLLVLRTIDGVDTVILGPSLLGQHPALDPQWPLVHSINWDTRMDDLCPRKRKGHNQKDDSSKRGPYQEFEEDSAQARKALIGLYAEKVITQANANGGSCHQGFVKNLVDASARVASAYRSHVLTSTMT